MSNFESQRSPEPSIPVVRNNKSGSRPLNNLTENQQKIIDEVHQAIPNCFKGDAHTFLMTVYKDQRHPLALRLDAAKTAIKYEKPALATIEANVNVSLHEAALAELE